MSLCIVGLREKNTLVISLKVVAWLVLMTRHEKKKEELVHAQNT